MCLHVFCREISQDRKLMARLLKNKTNSSLNQMSLHVYLLCGVCLWLSAVSIRTSADCNFAVFFYSDMQTWLRAHLCESSKCFIHINNLLLPQTRSLYAGSDSGVVQSPTAFCGRYLSCSDCVLARDPYCAWDPHAAACVNIFDAPSQRLR